MICKICGNKTEKFFTAKVLEKYIKDYYYCQSCHFLAPNEIVWLEEAYQQPINLSDTGLVSRNLYFSWVVSTILFFLFQKNATFLDYAGGNGLLTRLMRDIGFDFYTDDPYSQNILARGFEYRSRKDLTIELITAFECFEHFPNPLEEVDKILSISKNVIFSTELLPHPPPAPEDWDYYSFEHGQHVSFYSLKTLTYIAKKYQLNFHSCNNIHLFTNRNISDFIYRLIIKTSKLGLQLVVKKLMTSKTVSDQFYLIKQHKDLLKDYDN